MQDHLENKGLGEDCHWQVVTILGSMCVPNAQKNLSRVCEEYQKEKLNYFSKATKFCSALRNGKECQHFFVLLSPHSSRVPQLIPHIQSSYLIIQLDFVVQFRRLPFNIFFLVENVQKLPLTKESINKGTFGI